MDPEDRLRRLEAEVRQDQARTRQSLGAEPKSPAETKSRKPALKPRTKKKILFAVALVLTFLLVWSKVRIHFVVFTSFWGFLGILAAVFFIVYLVLRYLFDDKSE